MLVRRMFLDLVRFERPHTYQFAEYLYRLERILIRPVEAG